jgi:hypothetical protein
MKGCFPMIDTIRRDWLFIALALGVFAVALSLHTWDFIDPWFYTGPFQGDLL